MRYNIPLINALVLHVGTQAIAYIHSKGLTPSMSTIAHSSHMDIFQNLAVDLDTEGMFLETSHLFGILRKLIGLVAILTKRRKGEAAMKQLSDKIYPNPI